MLEQHSSLQLQLPNGRICDLGDKAVIYLGRQGADEEHDLVDLTPFGALEYGVSRTHALISHEQGNWYVMDLESHNDTLLNGARLYPGQRYRLSHADRLSLGGLELLVLL
jgi:pSer/pThr/pTyr-binding forkhead associated (FHA) protein